MFVDIQGKKDLVAVDNNEYDDEAGEAGTSDNEESHDEAYDGTSSNADSDEERRRYFSSLFLIRVYICWFLHKHLPE